MTMAGYAGELAHRLAQDAEAVCRCYLSNGRREGRYWLVGDINNTPGRSMFVRLSGPESGKGRRGQMGRRGHRRTWRPARCDPALTWPCRLPRHRRGSPTVPQSATAKARPRASTSFGICTGRLTGIGTSPVRHVATDCGHCRRDVFANTRHCGFARNRSPAFPSALLLSPGPPCGD